MKSPYVSELQPNQIVSGTFLVQHKDIRQKKTGEPCLSLTLGDRTGDVDARMWDNVADVMNTFERDDFVRVRGLLQVHQNRLQLTVHKIQRQAQDSVDVADFFPTSERSLDEMWGELLQIGESLSNPHLRALVANVLADPEIASRYKIAPAAKNVHHAYLGGLLEHVLSMCALARQLASHYKNVDLDLLLTGVIFHDIGKIYELTYDRSFGYSTQGQLLGHIVIGLRILADKLADLPEFPVSLRSLLEHLIISHHGELEYGSPKLPMFSEALLLHHIDNLDSKMDCMRSCLNRDKQVEGCWTGYLPALERPVLKKAKYLEDGGPAQRPNGAALPVTPVATSPHYPPPAPSPSPAPVHASSAVHSQATSIPGKSTSLLGDKLQAALRRPD